MWQYQNTDELYHHGVIGQRWGIRRYQNKDGSLTPLGKRKADKLLKNYTKITGNKIQKINNKTIIKRNSKRANDINLMSNEELSNRIRRIELEQRYASLMPKKVSLGKRFISTVTNKVIVPGLIDGGKRVVSNLFDQAIGRAVQKKKPNIFGTTYMNNKKNKAEETAKDTIKQLLNKSKGKTNLGTYDVSKTYTKQIKKMLK